MATIKLMNQDLMRLDWFDGTNSTRCQDKLKFLLTALKIFYILDPELAPLSEPTNGETKVVKVERQKRQEDELTCRGHILNALSDRLYDLYTNTTSTKEIWEALESKYKAEEEGTKKFLISKYFDFKFLDDIPLLLQVHELQVIVNKLKAHFRIKEKSRLHDKSEISFEGTFKANAVEKSEPPTKFNKRKPLRNFNKSKKKTKGGCFGKVSGWWYDTCAIVHVSYDKTVLKTYHEMDGDQEIQMGNEIRPKVIGKGNVDIIFTSEKFVTLTNVLHVPDMNRNLVSCNLLRKPGIKCVYESGKLVLSLNGKFVGKSYFSE
ncbi:uncharacterized protein LOC111400299 [Olea europaea var. sylvestris]|uniref:uncharacterized protein LOC111400299 n=1 Tax=Olea europaea var. sylvestris TaxID=158386 RepID=UPI000C1D310C|nr:uncharacterized protein LOC111400299 [Olea europaea var. sylvestris]